MARKQTDNEEVKQPVVSVPIHIDEFLMTKFDLRDEVQAGFRVFMRGKSYQNSFDDFEKELKAYFDRKI